MSTDRNDLSADDWVQRRVDELSRRDRTPPLLDPTPESSKLTVGKLVGMDQLKTLEDRLPRRIEILLLPDKHV